ncbi:MAG: MoaD/ThiS family protein [Candidatus Hydrothermarchaeales archaeon]
MVVIKLFAGFREKAKRDRLEIDVSGETTLDEIITLLKKELPELKEFFESKTAVIAINQKVAELKSMVKNEDEIAIFPPVSGG